MTSGFVSRCQAGQSRQAFSQAKTEVEGVPMEVRNDRDKPVIRHAAKPDRGL